MQDSRQEITSPEYLHLEKIQKLVIDIIGVQRNHYIPETERRENVAEHSFSVAMLCWRIFETVRPPLDIAKTLKYALAHDFVERGQRHDVNTYANDEEREAKKKIEAVELAQILNEMKEFGGLVETLAKYEKLEDEESLFVWTVDKIQAIVLGRIDHWRPYKEYGVSYGQFSAKGEEILGKCSPYLKELFTQILEYGRQTYYDQPSIEADPI